MPLASWLDAGVRILTEGLAGHLLAGSVCNSADNEHSGKQSRQQNEVTTHPLIPPKQSLNFSLPWLQGREVK